MKEREPSPGARTRLAARRVASRATHADIARGGDESQASADVDGLSETTFREGEAASSRARRGDVHDRARQKWREDARDGRVVSSRTRDVCARKRRRGRDGGAIFAFRGAFPQIRKWCMRGRRAARRAAAARASNSARTVPGTATAGRWTISRRAVGGARCRRPPARVALDAHARRLRRDRRPPPVSPPPLSRLLRAVDLSSRGALYPWRRPPRRCRRRPPPGRGGRPVDVARVPRPRRPRGRRVHGRGALRELARRGGARARALRPRRVPPRVRASPPGRITPRPSTPLDASRATATDACRAHPASARVERAERHLAHLRAAVVGIEAYLRTLDPAGPGGGENAEAKAARTRRKLDATRALVPAAEAEANAARDDAAPLLRDCRRTAEALASARDATGVALAERDAADAMRARGRGTSRGGAASRTSRRG